MLDIYVINLIERTDRWENIINTFGKEFNLIKVEAIKDSNGEHGCFLSHKKCIQIAKDKGLKNIIVFEDDCIKNPYIEFDFSKKANNIMDYLNNCEDWDIFIGACNFCDGEHIIKRINCDTEDIFQMRRGTTAHFIVYNSSCYDFYLNADITKCPVDILWYDKLKTLTILPFIAYQSAGLSNIQNRYADYVELIRSHELKLLEHIKKHNL